MAAPNREYTGESATSGPAGVPLGGIGAGCMEMGRDGRFRNITINNNRTAQSRIDVAPGTLLAIRAVRKGRIATRILQAASDLPFEQAGLSAPYTPADNLTWRGLYPSSQYKLDDPNFPLEVSWVGMSPVIPYDLDAATLPLVLINLHVKNESNDQVQASVMLNWENLCGCTRGNFPEKRGPIRPIVVSEQKDSGAGAERVTEGQGPKPAGLEFGFAGELQHNAEGQFCLIARQQSDQEISLMAWNESSIEELRVFWNVFVEDGKLGNAISRSPDSHAGAVCCTLNVPGQSGRNISFFLAWHCPRFVSDGVDMGNAYANRIANVREVVAIAGKHFQYYFRAVDDWHRRLLGSTLPRWMQRMLINSNSVFSTNTLYTREGRFAMFESPAEPLTGVLSRRFYNSLATVLFFPELEYKELTLLAEATDPHQPGRLHHNLGSLGMHSPNHGPYDDETLDTGAKFVLMAYRDYFMTGRRAILEHLYPRMKEVIQYLAQKDTDADGIPDARGYATGHPELAVYGANSFIAGLWIAALRAMGRIAAHLNDDAAAEQYESMFLQAVDTFNTKLWNEDGGYYRLYSDSAPGDDHDAECDACHSSQLAGQWYADFLCLGSLFPHERSAKAIESMYARNEHVNGAAEARDLEGAPYMNPSGVPGDPMTQHCWVPFAGTQYACLQMQRGNVDRGLYTIQKIYKNTQVRRGRTYNQPLCWDLKENEATGPCSDRHMGAPFVWHVLYALQGFFLNMVDQTLWLRPNLPRGVFSLSAPLITPTCFGWMDFAETPTGSYRQRLLLSFDSPVHVSTIVLRVPPQVQNVGVQVITPEGSVVPKNFIGSDGRQRYVELDFEKPILIGSKTRITLVEMRPAPQVPPATA